MRIVPALSAIALAVLLGAPASASWSSFGNAEPDNSYDDANFMRTDPPGDDTNLIYFNAWTVQAVGLRGHGVNPNVGALGTRNEVGTIEGAVGILGVWTDCNGDGYVGAAESAVKEYDSTLLLDSSVCPPSVGEPGTWDGTHNYNGWVVELVPIGGNGLVFDTDLTGEDVEDEPGAGDNSGDLRVIRDLEAKIWGDYGLPDQASTEAGGGSCPIRPFPRNTMADTGGLLYYGDCSTGLVGLWNRVLSDEITLNPADSGNQTVPGPGDPLGLRFADEDDTHSGPLGQITVFGDQSGEKAAVSAYDCSGEPAFKSSDAVNDTGIADATGVDPNEEITITLPSLGPTTNTDFTLAGQLNDTNEEQLGDCDGTNNGDTFWGNQGVEADFEGVDAADKRAADINFEFEDNGRVASLADLLISFFAPGQVPYVGMREGGTGRNSNSIGQIDFEWASPAALVKGFGRTVRTDISANANDPRASVEPDAPQYITFYAHVGESTTDAGWATLGSSGVYGSAQCGSETSGVFGGWNCDKAVWYKNNDGTTQAEVEGGNGKVGDVYEFRDVDCQDGGNNLGIPTGIPALGEEACQAFA